MQHNLTALAGGTLLACLLSACGGGDGNPPLNTNLTISSATQANVVGDFSSSDTVLSEFSREAPAGGAPLCVYSFDRIGKNGVSMLLGGRAAFGENQAQLANVSITVGGGTYASTDPVNTSIDRSTNQIVLNGKQLVSTMDGSSIVVVTGRVAMPFFHPPGC